VIDMSIKSRMGTAAGVTEAPFEARMVDMSIEPVPGQLARMTRGSALAVRG
jgi:hypothetical protein